MPEEHPHARDMWTDYDEPPRRPRPRWPWNEPDPDPEPEED